MEEARTLSDLAHVRKTVGVNQSRKAVRNHRAKQVFLACDAAPGITAPLAADCPALTAPHTLVTPHVAFATRESMSLRAEIVFDNLRGIVHWDACAGRRLPKTKTRQGKL